jgi:TonB family protein
MVCKVSLSSILFFLVFSINLTAQTKKFVFVDESSQKKGVIDGKGNIIVPAIYDDIEPSPLEIFAGKKDGKMILFNGDGSIRVPLNYQHIQARFNNFPDQFGYAAVTKSDKVVNSWGMIRDDGKVIIPEKYQYVRAVNRKLLVARTYDEKILYFFNEKGEMIKSIPGKKIDSHEIDNTCFSLEGPNHANFYYTSDLVLVTPKIPGSGYWTNGSETILRSGEGIAYSLGMVNDKGDTIIPFKYQSFKHGLQDQWICSKRNSDYTQETSVVCNNRGEIIIPENNYTLLVFNNIYLAFEKTEELISLYDKSGKKLLPGKYNFSRAYSSKGSERFMFDQRPDCYELKNKSTGELYFLNKNGKITNLNGYNQFEFFSDKYPLIATKTDDSLGYYRSTLMDYDGKKLVDSTFFKIEYTGDPDIFFVKKDIGSEIRIFYLKNKKYSIEKYKEANWMLNDYYTLQNKKEFILLDKKMKKIFSSPNIIREPANTHYIAYHKAKILKGKMVAIMDNYINFPVFIAINEFGDTASIDPGKFEKRSSDINNMTIENINSDAPLEIVVTKEMGIMEESEEKSNKDPEIIEKAKKADSDDEILTMAEQMPFFPGGPEKMIEFMAKNIKYPQSAMENGIEGKVIIGCVVEKDGTLTECNVIKGIGGGCDQEALSLVKSFPKFIPGKQNGLPARVKYTLPVMFKIN